MKSAVAEVLVYPKVIGTYSESRFFEAIVAKQEPAFLAIAFVFTAPFKVLYEGSALATAAIIVRIVWEV